ncbi:MAG: hypothetical protein PV362_01180 [Providencia heimbachae]|nr:hypothetical protein [Providencia heimbachae]
MLFQDRVVELLKSGQSMSIASMRSHFESNGIKALHQTVRFAISQLELFEAISLVAVEENGKRVFGYKLNDNYEAGLARQANSGQRHKVRTRKPANPKKIKVPVVVPEYGAWCQTGEPARLQVMFNELLAKPRAKRVKRGLAV